MSIINKNSIKIKSECSLKVKVKQVVFRLILQFDILNKKKT